MEDTDRAARLALLRSKASKSPSTSSTTKNTTEGTNGEGEGRSINFRNYTPKDDTLTEDANGDEDDGDGDNNETNDDGVSKQPTTSSITKAVKPRTALEQALYDATHSSSSSSLTSTNNASTSNNPTSSLTPRKPNYDLKRDVAKKLKRLDKRTERAIVTLVRKRLVNEASSAVEGGVSVGEID